MNEYPVAQKDGVAILTHPNIPKPLHGISPRAIMGQHWWDVQRKKAYAEAGQKCEACGTPRAEAWPSRWLEAHEEYEYLPEGVLVFKKIVCLCPACHKFIHSGLRDILVQTRKMNKETNLMIENHGKQLLRESKLLAVWFQRHEWLNRDVEWGDFRMIFQNQEYGPSSQSYAEWERGVWKTWKPENEVFK